MDVDARASPAPSHTVDTSSTPFATASSGSNSGDADGNDSRGRDAKRCKLGSDPPPGAGPSILAISGSRHSPAPVVLNNDAQTETELVDAAAPAAPAATGVLPSSTPASQVVASGRLDLLPGLASSPARTSSRDMKGKGRAVEPVEPGESHQVGSEGVEGLTEAATRRGTAEELELAKQGKYGWRLQDIRCMSRRIKEPLVDALATHKCQECTSKASGHLCAFLHLRSFPLSRSGRPLPYPVFRDSTLPDDPPLFPCTFDAPLTPAVAAILKTAAATNLVPTLVSELAHAQREGAARIRRQLGTTHTCDGCAAALLLGSWICRTCGREYCLACGDALRADSHAEGDSELHPSAKEKLVRCRGKGTLHTPADWVPLARSGAEELERTLHAMQRWSAAHPLEVPATLPSEWVERHRVGSGEREEGLRYIHLEGALVPPRLDEGEREPAKEDDGPTEDVQLPDVASVPLDPDELALLDATRAIPPNAPRPPGAPPALSQTALFRALWALGEPLLVTLSPPHTPRLPWTPAFLARAYGSQRCRVGSNRLLDPATGSERERETTVGAFFEGFGKRGGARSDSEKIKDWPAANDFKDEYPDLWHDFMDVLPAGSITRRDGVLNISAHMPRNANPPDLGPKGYFSEISEDGPGGNGSTKLHSASAFCRDVADAVNIMLWASDAPDGGPGVAVWDLYRAEDADKIRDFLYGHIARLEGWANADEARRHVDDPIHTQKFFLDASLRASLFASHGVRAFRIHQRPGQAVFIPAGCAHQVCNMADCIKVATDFVSVENVARCWKVTDEFRAQTKDKVLWRSDVLQLKSMLLWAWHSAERLDYAPTGGAGEGGPGALVEGERRATSSSGEVKEAGTGTDEQ